MARQIRGAGSGRRLAAGGAGVGVLLATGAVVWSNPLPSTSTDFVEKGTQARTVSPPAAYMTSDLIPEHGSCMTCHAGFEDPATTVKPGRWRGSLHAHAYRDPIFQAAFVIAQQDAPGSSETCIRCHSPRGWLEGRATPPTGNPNGSTLFISDVDTGVTCNVCHRIVDPVFDVGNPPDDVLILNALSTAGFLPDDVGNGKYVIDPMDVRRGPFSDAAPPHLFAFSPYHRSGDLCGTCHDVSNPMLSRVGGVTPAPTDTYVLNPFNQAHPTDRKTDMFPEQRTYSEWANSAFNRVNPPLMVPGVDMGGRFGGNRTIVSSCQDCHMPAATGQGCLDVFEPPVRNDLPTHGFVGGNVFAIDLLVHLYGPTGTGEFDSYTIGTLQRTRAESITNLQLATDTAASQFAGELNVRTTNQCGHKLLTGMPEGTRIWKNVRFFNGATLIAERGAYDTGTAVLSTGDTKVYECVLGIDPYMAGQTGEAVGPSFNLVLVNTIVKDNRIPPRGFTNAAFAAVQAQPVGYQYDDGQHWDDTKYCIPAGATRAEVTLFYQTASKEYIEFLRDENTTDSRGLTLFNAWNAVGRSAPIAMDTASINLVPFVAGDVTNDGQVGFADITAILTNWARTRNVGISTGDANCDGQVNFGDITFVLTRWGQTL